MIELKDNRWVSFGGHRQSVSELSPELRKKLGIEDLPDKKEKVQSRFQETKVSKVRSSPRIRERIIYVPVPTKETVRSKDSGADIIAKCVGRSLGRLYGRFKYG